MGLGRGAHIGPYEIVELIGTGGMGEVYRAHDPRLGRDVAVKLMRDDRDDRGRLRRFRDEIRITGLLDHPNVVAVHDAGEHDGAPYLVCELLVGQSLRERVGEGPLDRASALAVAVQIARGLAAIHTAGIVHRDLKPANVMLLADGRLKIVDFGVARARPRAEGTATGTGTGASPGTVAYMAPEQVRGDAVDARTDIFALGVVLHEMLSGVRPFAGESDVEVGYAILKAEPPPLADADVDALVRGCLAKEARDRYQSARDLALAIDALRAGASPLTIAARPARSGRWRWWAAGGVAASTVALAALSLGGHRGTTSAAAAATATAAPTTNTLSPLSWRTGIVRAARFAPDGHTIVYAAAFDGEPTAIYTTQPGVASARTLVADAELLAVSAQGDLAVLTGVVRQTPFLRIGTLARTHLQGGAPRAIATDVISADWTPAGELALVRTPIVGGLQPDGYIVEWPAGTRVHTSPSHLAALRVAPDGGRLAFLEYAGDATSIVVLDRAGAVRHHALAGFAQGLAWTPDGGELWTAVGLDGSRRCVYAVGVDGARRVVQCGSGDLALLDVGARGRALVSSARVEARVRVRLPDSERERELRWQDNDVFLDITDDGRTLVAAVPAHEIERGLAAQDGAIYVRDVVGGGAPVMVSQGDSAIISPDGRRLVVERSGAPGQRRHLLVPTGPGQERELRVDGGASLLRQPLGRTWTADSARYYASCGDPGSDPGPEIGGDTCVFDLDGNGRRIARGVRPLGLTRSLTPDGKALLVTDGSRGGIEMMATDGGARRPLPKTAAIAAIGPGGGMPVHVGWGRDGTNVFVWRDPMAAVIELDRLDLATGTSAPWRVLGPDDRSGDIDFTAVRTIAGGAGYAYGFRRTTSELYLLAPLDERWKARASSE